MRVYTNTVEHFVANDFEDLKKCFSEHYGSDDEFVGDGYFEWVEVEPTKYLTIQFETDDFQRLQPEQLPHMEGNRFQPMYEMTVAPGGYVKIKARIDRWIECSGHGFLCSTEY